MTLDASEINLSSDKLNFENILRIIKQLMRYENRIAGTKQIKEASLYIKGILENFPTIQTWIDKFPIYTSFPGDSELRIIEPIQRSIKSFPNLYSLSTPSGGLSGDVVYVDAGGKLDYEGKHVKNRIILADLSYAPPRPEKAWIAQNNGAKALILSNWGHPENTIVGRGAIKHRWGPLVIQDLDLIPRIPSINIARKDAEYMKKLLNEGNIRVNVECNVKDQWVTSNQPMCRVIPKKKEFPELLVVGAHLEAWGGTTTDNTTGNAIMIEIARTLTKMKKGIKREIIMGFWDGHEIGEAAGSGWFVDNYWSNLKERGIAYINIDGCGMKETSSFISYSSPETWNFLDEVEIDVLGKKSHKKLPLKIGDNSFLGIGIPYIFTFTTYSDKKLEEMGNAIFGWWYHSEEDTLDKLDEELLNLQAELYFEYVYRLGNAPIIPWDYEFFIKYVIQEFNIIKQSFNHIPYHEKLMNVLIKINMFLEKTKILNEQREELLAKKYEETSDREKEDINKLNKLLLNLGRYLIPAFRTATERYSHDPYGYSILAKPLPRIYEVLEEIKSQDIDSFEYKCLVNQLVRQYNILDDAISDVIYLTDSN